MQCRDGPKDEADLISALRVHNRNQCGNPILLLRYRGFRALIRVMASHVAMS